MNLTAIRRETIRAEIHLERQHKAREHRAAARVFFARRRSACPRRSEFRMLTPFKNNAPNLMKK